MTIFARKGPVENDRFLLKKRTFVMSKVLNFTNKQLADNFIAVFVIYSYMPSVK